MLRYAPPIYTVIIIRIIFVIFIILYSVINNVSYSRLRIYCLIHTPLSPLSCLSAPPEGDCPSIQRRLVRVIPDLPRRHPFGKGSTFG